MGRALPSPSARALLAAVAWVGAFTVAALTLRLGALFEGRLGALATLGLVGAALALALLLAPWWSLRRRRVEAAHALAEARAGSRASGCPRCGQALSEGGCQQCGARVLEAEGLRIVFASDAEVRGARWRAAARAGLRAVARPRPSWAFSSVLWTASTTSALVVLWGTAAALGGTAPSALAAPLALDRQVPEHGVARARDPLADVLPREPPTRPSAPAWTGTQVLAQRGAGPYHELAFIVRTERSRAYVVYASGTSGWVRSSGLLAPELAPGDALEVDDGTGFAPATLLRRVGTALRVRRADGRALWTSAGRVRVRREGRHARGEGLESDVPAEAWVEARVGDALLPGLAVGGSQDHARVLVVFADGTSGRIARAHVRAQAIGPGVALRVEGASGPRIVAARVGDALIVVDEAGRRSWTALARVSRSP